MADNVEEHDEAQALGDDSPRANLRHHHKDETCDVNGSFYVDTRQPSPTPDAAHDELLCCNDQQQFPVLSNESNLNAATEGCCSGPLGDWNADGDKLCHSIELLISDTEASGAVGPILHTPHAAMVWTCQRPIYEDGDDEAVISVPSHCAEAATPYDAFDHIDTTSLHLLEAVASAWHRDIDRNERRPATGTPSLCGEEALPPPPVDARYGFGLPVSPVADSVCEFAPTKHTYDTWVPGAVNSIVVEPFDTDDSSSPSVPLLLMGHPTNAAATSATDSVVPLLNRRAAIERATPPPTTPSNNSHCAIVSAVPNTISNKPSHSVSSCVNNRGKGRMVLRCGTAIAVNVLALQTPHDAASSKASPASQVKHLHSHKPVMEAGRGSASQPQPQPQPLHVPLHHDPSVAVSTVPVNQTMTPSARRSVAPPDAMKPSPASSSLVPVAVPPSLGGMPQAPPWTTCVPPDHPHGMLHSTSCFRTPLMPSTSAAYQGAWYHMHARAAAGMDYHWAPSAATSLYLGPSVGGGVSLPYAGYPSHAISMPAPPSSSTPPTVHAAPQHTPLHSSTATSVVVGRGPVSMTSSLLCPPCGTSTVTALQPPSYPMAPPVHSAHAAVSHDDHSLVPNTTPPPPQYGAGPFPCPGYSAPPHVPQTHF